MTGSRDARDPRRVRVLVEVIVDQQTAPDEIFRIAREWKVDGLRVDFGYAPVPIPAPRERRQEIKRAGLRAVVMRAWIDPEQVSTLARQSHVHKVYPDGRLEPTAGATIAVDCAATGEPIGNVRRLVRQLGVDKIWEAGYRGEGIVVAMVDGGIAARGRPVAPGEDAAIPSPPATGQVIGGWPYDWGTTALGWVEHGNMTAFDVQAIAPSACLWDIRIWEPGVSFGAYVSNAISGYQAAVESHRLDGTPHILSNSWGLYASSTDPSYAFDPDSPFARAVEQALGEGILVLFSAGNCGGKCPFSNCGGTDTGPGKSILGPNGHPGVMTVGAADLDDEWCGYTSQGPAALPPFAAKPDFCGYTRFDGYFPSADPTVRDFDGGTSAATAVAAGVVALLVQKRPFLTQDEAKAALMETAEDIWAPGFDANSGAGIIRARAAFRAI